MHEHVDLARHPFIVAWVVDQQMIADRFDLLEMNHLALLTHARAMIDQRVS